MAEKTNEDIVLETLASEGQVAPRNINDFLKQLTDEMGSDKLASGETEVQKQVDSIITTLLDISDGIELEKNPTLPSLDLDESGNATLVEKNEIVDLTPVRTETIEKTIVQREITVSSDQVDKQTVNEIDFDKSDFTATRDGDVLTVSIKGDLGGDAYVTSTDPSLTQTVKDGEFWFWTQKGKLYIRYDSYWVQPHPS